MSLLQMVWLTMIGVKAVFIGALAASAAVLLQFCSGCATSSAEQELSPDMTLSELESRIHAARDPQGVFMHAKSYVQKQIVTTDGRDALVEIKYLAPDKYRLVTLKDNQPDTAIILNGDSAWFVNYQTHRVIAATDEQLVRLKKMYTLGTPGSSYQHLFAQVNLSMVVTDGREYYKMTCLPSRRTDTPLYIYVSKDSFLIQRVVIPKPLDYQSTIERYGLYEGVMIPERTLIEQNGIRSVSKIYFNKINAEVSPDEFLPPDLGGEEKN